MFTLKSNYVTDSANKKVAVQLNIKTYEKIEEIPENYSLCHLMEDELEGSPMKVEEANAYHRKLKKEK